MMLKLQGTMSLRYALFVMKEGRILHIVDRQVHVRGFYHLRFFVSSGAELSDSTFLQGRVTLKCN